MADPARIEACAQLLLQAAREAGFWVSPDLRIGRRDAATLLGMTDGHLKNLCSEGRGPRVYRIGGAGHRVTIGILDLAEWRESRCT